MNYIAGIVDSVPGVTWPTTMMTSAKWLEKPIWEFKATELWVTQNGIKFEWLMADEPPYAGDKYPHVVVYEQRFYLEDGHHRLVRSLIAGERTIACRWLEA